MTAVTRPRRAISMTSPASARSSSSLKRSRASAMPICMLAS